MRIADRKTPRHPTKYRKVTLAFFGGKFEGAEDSGREMLRLTQEIWWENIQNGKINKKLVLYVDKWREKNIRKNTVK